MSQSDYTHVHTHTHAYMTEDKDSDLKVILDVCFPLNDQELKPLEGKKKQRGSHMHLSVYHQPRQTPTKVQIVPN